MIILEIFFLNEQTINRALKDFLIVKFSKEMNTIHHCKRNKHRIYVIDITITNILPLQQIVIDSKLNQSN